MASSDSHDRSVALRIYRPHASLFAAWVLDAIDVAAECRESGTLASDAVANEPMLLLHRYGHID